MDTRTAGKFLPNLQVTTQQIKDIVHGLNSAPFNKNLTLVSFDEKTGQELLQVLNDVIAHLDQKQRVNFSQPDEDAMYNFTQFLKTLNFPSNFDTQFQRGIMAGDKKVVYPILHYILVQLQQMEERAYLARYLVNVFIPEDILMDEDMKIIHQEYTQLKAEFKVIHQQLTELKAQALPPQELRKEIDQLETEKQQLVTKISRLKTKVVGNREFQQLLEATSMLRKEQEQEALLMEKLQDQQSQLEWGQGNYLAAEQRLLNARKITAQDTSAIDMLNILRADVKKNREFCVERLGRELSEKIKRLDQVEQLINEPMVNQNDIDALQNQVRLLQREVQLLEQKANQANNSKTDNLSVYKQQASLVSRKKEKTIERLQKLEQDQGKLEKKKMQKEKEYEQARGGSKFLSGDQFYRYAQSLRSKKSTAQQMKTQLRDIRAELAVLNRTEQILKQQAQQVQREMRIIQRQQGIVGVGDFQDGLQQISNINQTINVQKGATLQEISKLVQHFDTQLKENRERLQPLVNQLRSVRTRHQQILTQYQAKKQQYDQVNASVQTQKTKLVQEVKTLTEETTAQQNKYHQIQAKIQLAEIQLKRIDFQKACRNEQQRLNTDYKSLKDWYGWRMEQQDLIIRDFRNRQKIIKESHEFNSQQVKMFSDLRKLLQMKMVIAQQEAGGRFALAGRDLGGEVGVGGRNRLVLGDDQGQMVFVICLVFVFSNKVTLPGQIEVENLVKSQNLELEQGSELVCENAEMTDLSVEDCETSVFVTDSLVVDTIEALDVELLVLGKVRVLGDIKYQDTLLMIQNQKYSNFLEEQQKGLSSFLEVKKMRNWKEVKVVMEDQVDLELETHEYIQILSNVHLGPGWEGEVVQMFVDGRLAWCDQYSGIGQKITLPVRVVLKHDQKEVKIRFSHDFLPLDPIIINIK